MNIAEPTPDESAPEPPPEPEPDMAALRAAEAVANDYHPPRD